MIQLEGHHKLFISHCRGERLRLRTSVDRFLVEYAETLADTPEVRKWLRERIKYYWYSPRAHEWQAKAAEYHEKWKKGIEDVRITHKRARLDELQREFDKIPEDYLDKVIETKSGREIDVRRRNTDSKVKVLERARVEIEGTTGNNEGGVAMIEIRLRTGKGVLGSDHISRD